MNNTGGTTYIFSHPFMRFVPDFFLFVLLKFYNKRKIKRLPDGGICGRKKPPKIKDSEVSESADYQHPGLLRISRV